MGEKPYKNRLDLLDFCNSFSHKHASRISFQMFLASLIMSLLLTAFLCYMKEMKANACDNMVNADHLVIFCSHYCWFHSVTVSDPVYNFVTRDFMIAFVRGYQESSFVITV